MATILSGLSLDLNSKGYSHIGLLSPTELLDIRSFIKQAIQKSIGVRVDDLGRYHSLVTDDQHKVMASKSNRILDPDHAAAVLEFDSIQQLCRSFPGYIPTSVVYGELRKEQRPEVYFRVVRPGLESDVGPVHCDRWFNELYEADFLDSVSYKIWISIESSAGLNGLFLYPASRSFALRYNRIETSEGPRPVPDFDPSEIGPELLVPATPGDAIIFCDTMFHKGAVNAAETTRVSVEITLCKPPLGLGS